MVRKDVLADKRAVKLQSFISQSTSSIHHQLGIIKRKTTHSYAWQYKDIPPDCTTSLDRPFGQFLLKLLNVAFDAAKTRTPTGLCC
jgi:hypothetical protein